MKIINTCDKIKSVFSDGFSLELWRKYAEEISKEVVSLEEEKKLITPTKNIKKDNAIFTKIFGSFIASKEEKNE